ncbi:MAG: hypothetical protein AAB037_05675 [Chloroflexota bacterium]
MVADPGMTPLCPYTYSSLVNVYFDEAERCLEIKCHAAAIAIYWSAVDYAIEHQLGGGAKLNLKTFQPRESVRFKSQDVVGKLDALWIIFPSLWPWGERLMFLYRCVRNPFVHAKLDSFVEKPAPNSPENVKLISVETSHGESLPLGAEVTLWSSLTDEEEQRLLQGLHKETHIIGSLGDAAHRARQIATEFLTELNRVVSQTDVPMPGTKVAVPSLGDCQVAYLYHLPLRGPLRLGTYTLWPYRKLRDEMIKTPIVREHLDRLVCQAKPVGSCR